jgi:hypothetical protein
MVLNGVIATVVFGAKPTEALKSYSSLSSGWFWLHFSCRGNDQNRFGTKDCPLFVR